MVVLTDTSDGDNALHPQNQSVTGDHGSPDLLSIIRASTKYTALAVSPKDAVIATQQAIKHSVSGRPGPTAVVFRSASINGEVDVESPPFIHPTRGYMNTSLPVAPSKDVLMAVALLTGAKKPVIMAGNGVHLSDAHEELQELAELLGAAVATSYKGKGAIAETHPLSVGMAGIFGQSVANDVIGDADVVLVVGARLTPADTLREAPTMFNPERQKIIQIDIDSRNAGWTFPLEVGLIGDARGILKQLLDESQQSTFGGKIDVAARTRFIQARKKKHGYFDDDALLSDDQPILPQRLVKVLRDTLEPDGIVSVDAGNNRVWMCHYFQTQATKTFFAPGGLAGMGWAMPAALALKLVHPNRQVVGVTGDGGFMMSVSAIQTAIQYKLPVVYVVMNDSALGMVRMAQGDRPMASEFGEVDHGAIARGFGAFGVQVQDPKDLPGALEEALNYDGPAVVDVVISKAASINSVRNSPRLITET
jgi:acetolactate synthase-1/2/3 large subunit